MDKPKPARAPPIGPIGPRAAPKIPNFVNKAPAKAPPPTPMAVIPARFPSIVVSLSPPAIFACSLKASVIPLNSPF